MAYIYIHACSPLQTKDTKRFLAPTLLLVDNRPLSYYSKFWFNRRRPVHSAVVYPILVGWRNSFFDLI